MELEGNKGKYIRSSFVPEDKTELARSLKITSIDEADEDTSPSSRISSKYSDDDDDDFREISSK